VMSPTANPVGLMGLPGDAMPSGSGRRSRRPTPTETVALLTFLTALVGLLQHFIH
jgi:hypothetical protein